MKPGQDHHPLLRLLYLRPNSHQLHRFLRPKHNQLKQLISNNQLVRDVRKRRNQRSDVLEAFIRICENEKILMIHRFQYVAFISSLVLYFLLKGEKISLPGGIRISVTSAHFEILLLFPQHQFWFLKKVLTLIFCNRT